MSECCWTCQHFGKKRDPKTGLRECIKRGRELSGNNPACFAYEPIKEREEKDNGINKH